MRTALQSIFKAFNRETINYEVEEEEKHGSHLRLSMLYGFFSMLRGLAFLRVCMDSCALVFLNVCMDSCACACVSQCLYGLLCFRFSLRRRSVKTRPISQRLRRLFKYAQVEQIES